MNKLLLTIIVIIVCSVDCFAQNFVERKIKIGVEAGANLNLIYGNDFKYFPKIGYILGTYVEGRIGKRFAWNVGVGISKRRFFLPHYEVVRMHEFENGSTDIISIRTGVVNMNHLFYYAPISFKLKIGKEKKWFVGVGMEFIKGIGGKSYQNETITTFYSKINNPQPNDRLAEPKIESYRYVNYVTIDGNLLTTVGR